MARTALALTALDPVHGVVGGGSAVDVANGMNVVIASGALPRGPTLWDVVLVFVNSFAGSKSIIVRGGISPVPAFRGTIGDLTVANAGTSAISYVGPFDPSRYAQADGSLNIDFTAATTGTVQALALPHRRVVR